MKIEELKIEELVGCQAHINYIERFPNRPIPTTVRKKLNQLVKYMEFHGCGDNVVVSSWINAHVRNLLRKLQNSKA